MDLFGTPPKVLPERFLPSRERGRRPPFASMTECSTVKVM